MEQTKNNLINKNLQHDKEDSYPHMWCRVVSKSFKTLINNKS